jgi:hypothetical protein
MKWLAATLAAAALAGCSTTGGAPDRPPRTVSASDHADSGLRQILSISQSTAPEFARATELVAAAVREGDAPEALVRRLAAASPPAPPPGQQAFPSAVSVTRYWCGRARDAFEAMVSARVCDAAHHHYDEVLISEFSWQYTTDGKECVPCLQAYFIRMDAFTIDKAERLFEGLGYRNLGIVSGQAYTHVGPTPLVHTGLVADRVPQLIVLGHIPRQGEGQASGFAPAVHALRVYYARKD